MKLRPLAQVTGSRGTYRVFFRATVVHPLEMSAVAEYEFAPAQTFARFRAAQNLANAVNATARGKVCK